MRRPEFLPQRAPVSANDSDRARSSRQIDEAFAEASRLAGSSLPPSDFYEQFLNRAIYGINANSFK